MRGAVSLVLCLAVAAGCAGRAAPPLVGPSSAPVMETPARVALIAAPQGDAEWSALGDEAAALLSRYLRINTTNPPGNEIVAARWLATVLRRDGIESQVFEPVPGKANLYARLRGDGSARPLILLNHMDVVLASPEYWQVDPFSGAVQGGYIWGRGALDMKGEGIAQLMTLLILKRAGVPLKRDVIFLATSDEEIGAGVGAGWFAERHPDLIRNVEFLITEGGTTRANERGGIDYFGVGTTEKSPFWLDMTARGTPGHGSRPTPDNPVHRLIRALDRIADWRTPLVVTPGVERYFRDLASLESDSTRANERGGIDYFGVGTTEKSPFWLDMTARGTPGHGSRPTPDNPVHRLIRALDRIADWRTPLVVTPGVERYFRDLSGLEADSTRRRWFTDIRAALRDSVAVRAITSDLTYNALLRNTISITGLKGSDKTNVIPPLATAALDVRLLPGQESAAFLAELQRVVGDTAVTFRPQGPSWPATESSTDTELFRAIEAAAHARRPAALVTTPMLAGFTDSHYFRRLGIASYGLGPFPLTVAESRGVHGNDERVSIEALRFGVRFLYDIVQRVVGR